MGRSVSHTCAAIACIDAFFLGLPAPWLIAMATSLPFWQDGRKTTALLRMPTELGHSSESKVTLSIGLPGNDTRIVEAPTLPCTSASLMERVSNNLADWDWGHMGSLQKGC